jgi:hypothetical protein
MSNPYWGPNNVASRIVKAMQVEAETDDDAYCLSGGEAAQLMDQISRQWEIAQQEQTARIVALEAEQGLRQKTEIELGFTKQLLAIALEGMKAQGDEALETALIEAEARAEAAEAEVERLKAKLGQAS